ncbi:unnamed protein product [Musa acuminata subsp. burmannicoides]
MASRHPHSDSTFRPEVMNIAVATAQDLIASASLFDRCLRLYLCIQCEDGWKRMVSEMRMVQTPPPLRSFRRHATHVDGTLDPGFATAPSYLRTPPPLYVAPRIPCSLSTDGTAYRLSVPGNVEYGRRRSEESSSSFP